MRRVVYRLDELAEADRVFHVEGEKDADRLATLGLRATTTPGGADQWRDDYADQIMAAGIREVVLLPDNDAPGERYASQAAESYLRRMLRVKIVRRPGLSPKGDVFDWLATGHTADDLAVLVDSTDSLTEAPYPVAEPSTGPAITLAGDDGIFAWPADHVEVHLLGARDSGGELRADCKVLIDGEIKHWGTLNLASTTMRESLVKKLTAAVPEIATWRERLELACYRMAEYLREGSPLVELRPAPLPVGQRDLIENVLPQGETTIFYGDGGAGKGYLALLCALAAISGRPILHLRPTRCTVKVAYLDWETTEAEIADRVHRLARGLGITLPPGLFLYRAMSGPLDAAAPRLRTEFAKRDVGLVIADSAALACGDEPETASAATRVFNPLRTFINTTRLLIAHVNRGDADKTHGAARPFGSVFNRNFARAAWEVKGESDDTDLTIACYLRKRNDGQQGIPPWGLRLAFSANGGPVSVSDAALAHSETLLAKATTWQQIHAALSNGQKTAEALALELDLPETLVRKTLERYREKKAVTPIGSTIPRPWGLVSKRES